MLNITTFYLIGIILFSASLIGGVWDLYLIWQVITIGAKIKAISGNLFSLILVIFFIILYKSAKSIQAIQDVVQDVQEDLKNLNVQEVKNAEKI